MNILAYYGIYVVYLIFCIYVSTKEYKLTEKSKWIVVHLLIVFFALYSGFRPLDVPDTLAYVNIFNKDINISTLISNGFALGRRYQSIEYIFVIIAQLFKRVIPSYKLFFIIISYVSSRLILSGTVACVKYINNEKENDLTANAPIISVWALYIMCFGLLYNCIAVRAGLTMGLGIFAIGYYLENKSWKRIIISIIIIVFASSIQTFAIVYLAILAVVVFDIKIEKKIYIFLWSICLVLLAANFAGRYIDELVQQLFAIKAGLGIDAFSSYLNEIDIRVAKQDWYRVIVEGLVVLVIYNDTDNRYKNYAVLNLIGICTIAVLYPINAVSRMADYFFLFIIPLVSSYLGKERKLTINKFIYYGVLFLLFPIQFIIVLQGSGLR